MKKQFFTLASLLVMGISAHAQVGIGTTTPSTSAMLDVTSTTKGLLKPRMTTAQRTAIAGPAKGLEVFDTDTNSPWYFDGAVWVTTGTADLRAVSSFNTQFNHITFDAGNGGTGTNGGYVDNVGIGRASLNAITGGDNNIAVGAVSGNSITSGKSNTFIGSNAGSKVTTGVENTAVGFLAGTNLTTGGFNTALGTISLSGNNNAGSYNIAVGYGSMSNTTNLTGSGANTAVGIQSLNNLSGGTTENVGIGDRSGANITTGGSNTALGSWALGRANSLAGGLNTAVGYEALSLLTGGGSSNTALGEKAFHKLTSGVNNIAIGAYSAGDQSSGSNNISIGAAQNFSNQSGSNQLNIGNVLFGTNMSNSVTGNIGIGTATPHAQAKLQVAADKADYGEFGQIMATGALDANKKLIIGYNTTADKGFIQSVHSGLTYTDLVLQPTAGNVGIGTTTPSSLLHVNGVITATKIQGPSDSRFKKNIKPIENALEKVLKLGGYTYDWKEASEFPNQSLGKGHDMGVIAQEVEKQFPEAVSTNADGYKAVSYTELVPALIEAIKTQQLQIEELKAEVSKLRK